VKKVAIITPSLITGGAETMVVRLATNINREKFDVLVICLSARAGSALEKVLDDKSTHTCYLGKTRHGSIDTLKNIWKVLSQFSPDVVHGHISGTIYAIPWIAFHRCKLIHTIHTKPDVEFSGKVSRALKILVKLKKMIPVAVSKENQLIASKFYKVDNNRCFYVNNPVEVEKYYKAPHNTGEVRFINVSRQDPNKNQILAVRAFAKLYQEMNNIRLTLVGNGNQHDALVAEVRRLGVSNEVFFPGEVSNAEDYLAQADIYVSTSHREGLPLSMLEAMAAELPVISSNVGGCKDIVDDNGILFEDDDEKALIDAMRRLAADQDMRKKMSEKSTDVVKEYDVKKCAAEYERLYDRFSKKG